MGSVKKKGMSFKDVKNNRDLEIFIKEAFKPYLESPKKFADVLKKAWTDQSADGGGQGSDTKHRSLRDLFPNYKPPPLEKVELVKFPEESAENPFDPLSAGRYFIYLTNRMTSISYLGSRIQDYQEHNSALSKKIPKGYTSLGVFQRIFIVTDMNRDFQWEIESERIATPDDGKPFYLFHPGGEYADWNSGLEHSQFCSSAEAMAYAKERIESSDYPILGGMLIALYNWH